MKEDDQAAETQEVPAQRVRAKFVVQKAEKNSWGGGRMVATPVMADSEENKRFFNATPNGTIELYVNNDVIDAFPVGKSIYVDFTLAE